MVPRVTKRYLFHEVKERLYKMKSQWPTELSEKQVDYLVRKALVYVMNGCNKKPAPPKNSFNYVYNYLPDGLREMESKGKSSVDQATKGQDYFMEENTLEAGKTPYTNNDPENKISTDPLNAILNPQAAESIAKPNELPRRHYMLGCFHLEWVMLKGKPQVYEINLFMSDHSNLTIFCVPDALKNHPDTMTNLGFVGNPDLHKFYFTEVGVGCIEALPMKKAIDKLSRFLEEKRHLSDSENKNNGLVLNCYSEEELAIFVRIIEANNKPLLVEIIKGFGCVQSFIDRNRSKKLTFSGAMLSVGGQDCYFHTEVRRELKSKCLVSKSKGGALFQALEFFLDDSVDFKNYFHPYCYPSFSPKLDSIKKQQIQVEAYFHVEVHLAAELKKLVESKVGPTLKLAFEGVFQPRLGKDLRDEATVIASKFCRLLVEAGLEKNALRSSFKKNPEFTINKTVLLQNMTEAQRWAVMEQTIWCINIVKDYFMMSLKDEPAD